jgi:hypothetical protein
MFPRTPNIGLPHKLRRELCIVWMLGARKSSCRAATSKFHAYFRLGRGWDAKEADFLQYGNEMAHIEQRSAGDSPV